MKQIMYLPMFAVLSCLTAHANAQSFDAGVGFGTGHAKSAGAGIENASSSAAFGACTVSSDDSSCQSTPNLDGLFMNLGGDVMFNKHFGVGAGWSFQPSKSDYGPLQYRQMFIDGNVLYEPVNRKRWGIQFQEGIGAARTGFSFSENSCVGVAVCVNHTQSIGTANHFQWHTGAGVEFLLTDHVFFRPEFDLHYVPNFNQQFGNNTVPMVMFNIGYTSRTRD